MKKNRVIAIWGRCAIELAESREDETMPEEGWESIGKLKFKSTTLETTDGEKLTLQESGGGECDMMETEGGYVIKTTVIEPTKLYKTLGLTDDDFDEEDEMGVKTHVVEKTFATRLTPQRTGGIGIKAPLCHIKFSPSGSEEEGGQAALEITLLKPDEGPWYKRFRKKAPAAQIVSPAPELPKEQE